MRFDEAYKKIVDDNIRMRCNFWKEGEFVFVNPQKPDEIPNKDMLIKVIENKSRQLLFAWTPNQIELLDLVWEEYQG